MAISDDARPDQPDISFDEDAPPMHVPAHGSGRLSGDKRLMNMGIVASTLGFINPIQLRLAAPDGQTLVRGSYSKASSSIGGESREVLVD